MRIGQLAERMGKSVAALRFYEQSGLLPAAERTEASYREFAPDSVERIRFITQAQERGFSLREIRTVLSLHDQGTCPCESVASAIRREVVRLDGQIAQLQARRALLSGTVRLWESGSPGSPKVSVSGMSAAPYRSSRLPGEPCA